MADTLTVDPLHEFFNLILKCFIPFKNKYNYYPHLTDEETWMVQVLTTVKELDLGLESDIYNPRTWVLVHCGIQLFTFPNLPDQEMLLVNLLLIIHESPIPWDALWATEPCLPKLLGSWEQPWPFHLCTFAHWPLPTCSGPPCLSHDILLFLQGPVQMQLYEELFWISAGWCAKPLCVLHCC